MSWQSEEEPEELSNSTPKMAILEWEAEFGEEEANPKKISLWEDLAENVERIRYVRKQLEDRCMLDLYQITKIIGVLAAERSANCGKSQLQKIWPRPKKEQVSCTKKKYMFFLGNRGNRVQFWGFSPIPAKRLRCERLWAISGLMDPPPSPRRCPVKTHSFPEKKTEWKITFPRQITAFQ